VSIECGAGPAGNLPRNRNVAGAGRQFEFECTGFLGKRKTMLGTILIIFLILALFGALPRWSHSRNWGYRPTGGLGFILVVVVILVLLGRI
jgi:hypothetical protein